MDVDLEKIGPLLRDARGRLGITQAALARYVDASQSAISMLERGRPKSLALPKIEKAAAWLGVDLKSGEILPKEVAPLTARFARYCPYDGCPTSVPIARGTELIIWPLFLDGPVFQDEHCGACGTEMRDTCINPECGAAAVKGNSHCRSCGTPYVVVTHEHPGDLEAWAKRRREDIAELRRMTGLGEAGKR